MKNKNRNTSIVFVIMFFSCSLYADSLVYNPLILKKSNSILKDLLGHEPGKHYKLPITDVVLYHTRKRHIIIDEMNLDVFQKIRTVGTLFDIRYVYRNSWWFECTTGLENERLKTRGTSNFTISRTGFDDILLSGGKIFDVAKNTQLVLFGITGLPTKRSVKIEEAQDTLVGTRFFSAGCGSYIIHDFINNEERTLQTQLFGRFVHFFDRKWFPILPRDAKIQPGNRSDVVFSVAYREHKNIYEAGFNEIFLTNRAQVISTRKLELDSVYLHSFYGKYFRFVPDFFLCRSGLVGTGFFVLRTKTFDTKSFSCWINFTLFF